MPELINLEPNPIFFHCVEFRFANKSIPVEGVFGLIHSKLKDKYPTLLKQKGVFDDFDIRPRYTILNEKYSISIGAGLLSFAPVSGYIGWESMLQEVRSDFEIIKELDVIETFNRVGMRYINFFEGVPEIFNELNVSFKINIEGNNTPNKSLVRTNFHFKKINCNIQIESDTYRQNPKGERMHGSILDIDASYNEPFKMDEKQLFKIIEECHDVEKRVFLSLMKESFLKKYNPKFA